MRQTIIAALVVVSASVVSAGDLSAASSVLSSKSRTSTESTTIIYQFPGPPKISVSSHGNIVIFDGPTGYNHIYAEGYVLCYGGISAYDIGRSETGFAAGTSSCKGTTCTFTRNTIDNRLQLQQVFTSDRGNRAISIAMTVRNLTSSPITGVVLRRHGDADVDAYGSAGAGTINNWFASSELDSAFAWNATNDAGTEGHAMVLSAKTPRQGIAKVTDFYGDTSCRPADVTASGPNWGDHALSLEHDLGTLAGRAARTVTVKYTRN
jgi:hypothetical protein